MSLFSLDFKDTEKAFSHLNNRVLKQSKLIFSLFKYPLLVQYGPKLSEWALKLHFPIKGIIKKTVFNQFCGGETIEECDKTVQKLYQSGIGSILDYSVEGEETELQFDANLKEILLTIAAAKNKPQYPFCVFKMTGIGKFDLLAKVDACVQLTEEEQHHFNSLKIRFDNICQAATNANVRLFVDAEETWIQKTIDYLSNEAMKIYNKNEVLIYNTIQLYRHDKLEEMKQEIANARKQNYKLGYKLVRGAYMEKEANRAIENNYINPIQNSKENTDNDYNSALKLCFDNRDMVSICAGTHNEESSFYLAQLMHQNGIANNDNRFWFAQLFGMSDHISFNLAKHGYNVAKYLPYGPIISVMPYLGRRAKENSSMSGQMGRELRLIIQELKRRGV